MDYIISKTDIATNGRFTIRQYSTDGPALPTAIAPLAQNAISANTSLILLGQGMSEYGDVIATDLVHMLENFSNSTPPVYPIQGQLWYKNNSKELFLYDTDSFLTQQIIINGLLTSDLNVNNHKISNVGYPIVNTDAVNKQYLEEHTITTSGGTLNIDSNIVLNGGEILGLPAIPSLDTAATSKLYVDTQLSDYVNSGAAIYLRQSGGNVAGTLTMNPNTHILIETPSGGFNLAADVVNKSYVDTAIDGYGAGVYVKTTGDAITGPLTITGTTLYTGATLPISTVNVEAQTLTILGNVTALFASGVRFLVTFPQTSEYPPINQILTTKTSTYDSLNTIITIVEMLPVVNSVGCISQLPGLVVSNGTTTELQGNFSITGVQQIDMGGNRIQNVDIPVHPQDVTNKIYVDNKITSTMIADGTLSSASIDAHTQILTLNSTVGEPITIDLSPVLKQNNDNISCVDNVVTHNIRSPKTYENNIVRLPLLANNNPNLSLSSVIDTLGTAVYNSTCSNNRHITPAMLPYTMTDMVSAHTELTILTIENNIVTVNGGDYTQSFKTGIPFNIFNNVGIISPFQLTTVSATFNVEASTTSILVAETIPTSATNNGVIKSTGGAVKIIGDNVLQFSAGNIYFNISDNVGTGVYIAQDSTYINPDTWILISNSTPLPLTTTSSGTIQLLSYSLPFSYIVEFNQLMVFKNGIKQYNSTRGVSSIVAQVPVTHISDTTLTNGTYSFVLSVDNGGPANIGITVNQPTYNILNVNISNKMFTVSGVHTMDFFKFGSITVTNNSVLPGINYYTITNVCDDGINTTIIVDSIPNGGLANDGLIRSPYEYHNLIVDLTSVISSTLGYAVRILFEHGIIKIASNTSGPASNITITDINLIAELPTSTIINNGAGMLYNYSESGIVFSPTNIVSFTTLPIVGDVFEFIQIK